MQKISYFFPVDELSIDMNYKNMKSLSRIDIKFSDPRKQKD